MKSKLLKKLLPLVLCVGAISPPVAQAQEEAPVFEQPAVITRFGNRSGAPAYIFPRPHENLPDTPQIPVTGLSGFGWPQPLAFCAADKILMAEPKFVDGGGGTATNRFTSIVSIVDLATGARVASLYMPDYGGTGTIAAPPSYNVVLASSNEPRYGFEDPSTNILHVISPPFGAGASVRKTLLPGFIQPYANNAIAFDPKTERAFVFHTNISGEGGGISVLDPPYSRVAFTMPCPWTDGDIAITPDGTRLLVTGSYSLEPTYGVQIYKAPFSAASRPVKLPIEANGFSFFGLAVTPDGSKALACTAGGGEYRKVFAISAPFDSNSHVEELPPLPPFPEFGGDGFESIDISPDGQLAILTGGDYNNLESAVFIKAPFTAAGAISYNVAIPGGRANGAVRFRPGGVVFAISVPGSNYKPGDEFLATIKLEYGGSKSMTVTFEEPLLAANDATILKVEPAELPPPVELRPGNSNASFTVPVRVNKYGVAELISKAVFKETDREPQLREATREVLVNPLSVSLRALPLINGEPIKNMYRLADGTVTDVDGNPISPKIEVKIENQGEAPLNTTIHGVYPRARDRALLLERLKVEGSFPLDVGTILGGDP